MTIWFTSDTHFGNRKMAEHRGFGSVQEMDDALISRWNDVVKAGDVVYHLGDVSFRGHKPTVEILRALNGSIRLVPGNHDKALKLNQLPAEVPGLQVLPPLVTQKLSVHQLGGITEVIRVVLCHFPLTSWDRMHYGVPHLHGHSHGTLKDAGGKRLDVGVDPMGLEPIALEAVLSRMQHKHFVAVDQHVPQA